MITTAPRLADSNDTDRDGGLTRGRGEYDDLTGHRNMQSSTFVIFEKKIRHRA